MSAQPEVVDAFLAAAREGDFERLVAVLDPEVVLRADVGPEIPMQKIRGAEAVARRPATFAQLALELRPVLISGVAGIVSFRDGRPYSADAVIVHGGRIVEMDILADAERLEALDLARERSEPPVSLGYVEVPGVRLPAGRCTGSPNDRPVSTG